MSEYEQATLAPIQSKHILNAMTRFDSHQEKERMTVANKDQIRALGYHRKNRGTQREEKR
jgi:hypothetical protein